MEPRSRMKSNAMVGLALALALAMPIAGCASGGKGRLSAAKICAHAGGKYNPSDQTCDAPAQSHKKAAEMCQQGGGIYDSGAQVCEVGME